MTEHWVHTGLVVASGRNRTYVVPSTELAPMFTMIGLDDPAIVSPATGRKPPDLSGTTADLTVSVNVVDGRPQFREIVLTVHGSLSPLQVRNLPWARYAEAAIEKNAVRADDGRSDYGGVFSSRLRERERDTHQRWRDAPARRSSVTDDRLTEVVRLHDEAPPGSRWDEYAAARFEGGTYRREYMRKLFGRARKAGLVGPEGR